MHDDLIFHLTRRGDFKKFKKNNTYQPESVDSEGFIHCSTGDQIEESANQNFSDKQQILLLIIDVSTLSSELKYEEDPQTGKKYPHIYGPLNMDAIMDKLSIFAEKDGKFSISFSSTT